MSVVATLTWTPNSASDTSQPPPTVDVLEAASASDMTAGGSPGVTGSADDGLGDAPTYPFNISASSTGSHLTHLTVPPGQTSISLPSRALSAMLPNTPGTGDTRVPSELLSYTVQIDTRSVTITRSNARSPGIVYSPDNQPHGEYVDASGVGHGETIYSSLSGSSSPTLDPNWQFFDSTLVGNWTQKTAYDLLGQPTGTEPDVTWAWSPAESEDTIDSGKCEMPKGGITYDDNGNSSGTAASTIPYSVAYGATDNGNGATATAAYVLTLHEQWDNLRLDPAHPFDVVDNINLVQINGQNYPVQINPDYSSPMPIGPLTIGGTVGLQFSAQLNGSFKLSDFFTLGGNFTATGSIAVTANQSITGPAIPPRCYVQLTYEVHYHTNHWLTDHYLPSGYDATYTQLIDDQKDAVTSLFWAHPIQLAGSGLGGNN